MAKISDTHNNQSPSKKSDQKPTPPLHSNHEPQRPKKRRKKHLYTFTVFIVTLMVLFALYTTYENIQSRQDTKKQMKLLLSQLTLLKNQQVAAKLQMDNTVNNIHSSQDAFKNQLTQLDKNLQTALQQNLFQTKDWLLLKARYYLELAQINTHWSDDLQSTHTLLQQADTILSEFHDESAIKIRQAIANEMEKVDATPKIDLAGLLSQLDAAQKQIADLSIKTSLGLTQSTSPKSNEAIQGWRGHMQQALNLLERLVIIRHHDGEISPPPSLVYESMIREGIRLNLQEAQWAALQNNESIYQFSLNQAIKNIQQSFNLEEANTSALLKKLDELQHADLAPKKLSLDQSLPLLNQWIESKESKPSRPSGESAQ